MRLSVLMVRDSTMSFIGRWIPIDFGGCGGPQPLKSTRLTFEADVV